MNEGNSLYAQSGRQDWGQANAAGQDVYVERPVWLPTSIVSLADDARKYRQPVSVVVEFRVLPNGELYIHRQKPSRQVWRELQELIDP